MKKALDLTKRKKGDLILLETKEAVFEIKVITPSTGRILIQGGKRFKLPTEAKIIGSYGALTNEKENLRIKLSIEHGIGIQINYLDEEGNKSEFITAPVISANITGEGFQKGFEVWEDKELERKLRNSLNEARMRLTKGPESNENTLS